MAEIVIIEDDKAMLQILTLMLEGQGHTVFACYEGKEGLETIKRIKPALVISDLLLPNMHGIDICRTIREDGSLNSVKIILMTAVYKESKYRNEASQYGVSGYINKPFNNNYFIKKVNDVIGCNTVEEALEEENKDIDIISPDMSKRLSRRLALMDKYWKLFTNSTNNKKFLLQLKKLSDFSDYMSYLSEHTDILKNVSVFEAGIGHFLEHHPDINVKMLRKMEETIFKLKEVVFRTVMKSVDYDSSISIDAEMDNSGARLIYIVDKDKAFIKQTSILLREQGFVVAGFEDLFDLVKAVSDDPPAIIIIELDMLEESSGDTEIIEKCCQPSLLSIPIVYTSEKPDFETRLKACNAHGTLFFPKPFNEESFLRSINTLIGTGLEDPSRVLIIDTDKTVAHSLMLLLESAGMEVRLVSHPEKTIEALDVFDPELILLGRENFPYNSYQLAKMIRQFDKYYNIPVIFLTNNAVQHDGLDVPDIGLDGHIPIDIAPNHFISAITIRARHFKTLKQRFFRDPVTGLLNYSRLKEQLYTEVRRAKRENNVLSFVLMEVLELTDYKLKYGSILYDKVMKRFADYLLSRLRTTDIVGRFGGDRFGFILPGSCAENTAKIIGEIQESFYQFECESGQELGLSFYTGIAEYPVFPKESLIILSAERALASSKIKGKNSIIHAKPR